MHPLILSEIANPHPYTTHRIENEYWFHRGPWMEGILKNIEQFFKHELGSEYQVMILTTSILGAKEALLSNVLTEDSLLWSNDEEAKNVAHSLGAHLVRDKKRAGLALVRHDTPRGALVDLQKMKKAFATKKERPLLVGDVSRTFGGVPMNLKRLGYDGYLFTPEHALGGVPGVVVLAYKKTLLRELKRVRKHLASTPYTFDLLKYHEKFKTNGTPYSPNISTSVALEATLTLIHENGGVKAQVERHECWAQTLRKYLRKAGLKPKAHVRNTGTSVILEGAKKVAGALLQKGVHVEVLGKSELRFAHKGYFSEADLERIVRVFNEVLKQTISVSLNVGAPMLAPRDALLEGVFSLLPCDFVQQAEKKARARGFGEAYEKKIIDSAHDVFFWERDRHFHSCHRERSLGFIGAGNVVREAVARARVLGVKDIRLYSPSLLEASRKKLPADDHRGPRYWEKRGVVVAHSPEEVFFSCHTVVLLPTFHTKESVQILGKTKKHENKHLVSDSLLRKVEREGVMDLLTNASAREDLIDRRALAKHLTNGWLQYFSDELPEKDDPLLSLSNATMTGHVGGSCPDTQARVAGNTRLILREVICAYKEGRAPHAQVNGYTLNITNAHLTRGPWRTEEGVGSKREVRVLLTDSFDRTALDFKGLEKEVGLTLRVKDVSKKNHSESDLKRTISTFKPHIIMVRTRTKITKEVAEVLVEDTPLFSVVRPGVGIDNIYSGMETLSRGGALIINEPFGNSYAVAEMTIRFLLRGSERLLLTPGPTAYSPHVFRVMDNYIPPSTQEFLAAEEEIRKGLNRWIGLGGDIALITGPATALMEGAIRSLSCEGERGLVIVHGKFGNRFRDIGKGYNRKVIALERSDEEWGCSHSPQAIEHALKEYKDTPLSFVCLQQNETSSGVAYNQKDMERIVRAVRTYHKKAMIIVDAVSGTFAHDLDFKKIGADVVVLGSQKGLGVSSGYSYASLSKRAISYMLTRGGYAGNLSTFLKDVEQERYLDRFGKECGTYALSLLRLLAEGRPRRREVPSVFHALSTEASLALLGGKSKKEVVARHEEMAKRARKEARSLKLEFLSDRFSGSVTAILLPKSVSAPEVRKVLDEVWGIYVSGAQADYWKPQLIRVGHVGYVEEHHIARCMRALRIILGKKGG